MTNTFSQFFTTATGNNLTPYPYQITIASGPWPDLIRVPTGIGKTASIIIPWLWKYLQNDPETPRRLIYCLPMRVLVEQTFDCSMNWIDNLVRAGILQNDRKPAVHVLMGGNIQDDWQLFPERAAIVIGTQDQLLSRALNRGYSMSRFMWPVHFALLNTDCLWVLDEVQLMGSGIATSAQLQAFRKDLGTIFDTKSIWMSATHSGSWLRTVDFQKHSQNLFELGLSDNDKAHPEIKRRFFAGKPISRIDAPHGDLKAICGKVLSLHRRGSLTLVIVNRVQRAVELYRILSKKADADLVLIHSRFRPVDRRKALDRLLSRSEKDDMICVSTCNVAH